MTFEFWILFIYYWCFEPNCIKISDRSITHNIFRIQDNESIVYGFYCIAFIEYMLAGKTLSDYINLLSPNDYKTNGKIIYKYFKHKYGTGSKSRA